MMKQFDVRVKYKGRPYGSEESIVADSMTIEDGTYRFWLHNVDVSEDVPRFTREMTASFPVAVVESVKESGYRVSDAAVIHRVVDVIVVYVVEKAKADGEPLSEEQEKEARREWTDKLRELFATASAGSKAVRDVLAAANQWSNLIG